MKLSSKLLSLFLSFVLVVALFPTVAFADDATKKSDSSTEASAASTEQIHATGYIPEDFPTLSIYDDNNPGISLFSVLPEQYDSRDHGVISSVKDQGNFDTCWAFATTAAAEASILSEGLASSVDLSERHLAYFTYSHATDPLNGLAGDGNNALAPNKDILAASASNKYLTAGGNCLFGLFSYASWKGAANESSANYSDLVKTYNSINPTSSSAKTEQFLRQTALSDSLAYRDLYHLENCYIVDTNDTDALKQAIIDHGATTAAIHSPDSYSELATSYNSKEGALYTAGNSSPNHSITVIGWDDNYSRSNFITAPNSNGAWLCKNSWGSSWGKSGYFWLSYEDKSFYEEGKAYVFDMAPANNYDNIYQYDGSASTSRISLPSGSSVANVFRAKANAGGSEFLKAVSFMLYDVNVDYSIQIYGNLTDYGNPYSGTPLLNTPLTGRTEFQGYYTVDLDEPIALAENTKFSVVITMTHSDRTDVTFGFAANEDHGWVSMDNACMPKQSFVREGSRTYWQDVSADENQANARIKAFTSNSITKLASPKSDISQSTVGSIATQTFTGSKITPQPRVEFEGDVLVAGVDYTLSYANNVNAGTATVTITGKGIFNGSKRITFKIAKASLKNTKISGLVSKAYTGKAIKQVPTVKLGSYKLKNKRDFTITYSNNKKVGKAKVTVKGMGNFSGSQSTTFRITNNKQPMTLKAVTKVAKYSKVKKKAITVAKPVVVKNAKGALSYSNASTTKTAKSFKVNAKTGKVTIPKGMKKGTYKIKIKVVAKGTSSYAYGSKTIMTKIRVK